MKRINRLGLTVVLITAVTLLTFFGVFLIGKRLFFDSKTPTEQANNSPATNSPEVAGTEDSMEDSDSDGLPDLIENVYRTNPNLADSDGDSTNDADEVLLQRDPTKPGPNDLTVSDANMNYTQKYFSLLPSGASKDAVLDQARVEAFVEQEKGSLLLPLTPGTLKTTSESGKEAVQTYLESISSTHNPAVSAVSSADIEQAYRLASTQNNAEQLRSIISRLEKNVQTFKEAAAPTEAVNLHQKLIQASEALLANAKLLEQMPQDFVGGLIGAKKIEELGPIFQQIAQEITQLEEKYDLQ